MKKILIIYLILLLSLPLVQAATIQGTIYDIDLHKVQNVLVEVNSQPLQKTLAKDGTYHFDVPIGTYEITVKSGKNFNETVTTEQAEVKQEGIFTVDLFIFPKDEELDINLTSNPETDLSVFSMQTKGSWIVLIIIILVGMGIIVWAIQRRKKKPIQTTETSEEPGLERVLEIIKQEKRISQRDLRKQLPFSEAKVSLIITELEAKGKIQRIKKGRGNIILLR